MIYVRVDNNKNGTITDVSGVDFIDLQAHESSYLTDYDFPTGQPYIFYRWDGSNVVVNDNEVVKTFNPEALTGLDMTPHIESVLNGDFLPNTSKDVTIEGVNFTPFSQVEITGDGNFVNTVYFDTPKKIRANISVNGIEGTYNLIVKNNDLHSEDSGYNSIHVKNKTVVDLRTADTGLLGLDMTSGVSFEQDATNGIRFYSSNNSWNRGIKFSSHSWNRSDIVTFETVFTRTADVLFMLGIGSASLDVSSISAAYYKQEIGLFHSNNQSNSLYGGGDVGNWSQNIGTNVGFELNKYYKLKLENSGGENALCSISEVDVNDWDSETVLHSWISTCTADDEVLVPFIIPQAASGAYYITGFRF